MNQSVEGKQTSSYCSGIFFFFHFLFIFLFIFILCIRMHSRCSLTQVGSYVTHTTLLTDHVYPNIQYWCISLTSESNYLEFSVKPSELCFIDNILKCLPICFGYSLFFINFIRNFDFFRFKLIFFSHFYSITITKLKWILRNIFYKWQVFSASMRVIILLQKIVDGGRFLLNLNQ